MREGKKNALSPSTYALIWCSVLLLFIYQLPRVSCPKPVASMIISKLNIVQAQVNPCYSRHKQLHASCSMQSRLRETMLSRLRVLLFIYFFTLNINHIILDLFTVMVVRAKIKNMIYFMGVFFLRCVNYANDFGVLPKIGMLLMHLKLPIFRNVRHQNRHIRHIKVHIISVCKTHKSAYNFGM